VYGFVVDVVVDVVVDGDDVVVDEDDAVVDADVVVSLKDAQIGQGCVIKITSHRALSCCQIAIQYSVVIVVVVDEECRSRQTVNVDDLVASDH